MLARCERMTRVLEYAAYMQNARHAGSSIPISAMITPTPVAE